MAYRVAVHQDGFGQAQLRDENSKARRDVAAHRKAVRRGEPETFGPAEKDCRRVAVDQSIPLADTWKAAAVRDLLDQLASSRSPRDAIARFEASLADPTPLDPVEKSLSWLAECGGQISMDELADAASLSPRQFRRICLERTGLSPKHLARVLRFRQAAKYASGQHPDWADIAVASGYYDQAHLINEFKELAGLSPSQFSSLSVASHFRSQSAL